MAKIDRIFQQQPKEIARQVMRTLDKREHLKKINQPVYDGDLSWKKVSSGHERNITLSYGNNDQGLSSIMANPSKKLNIL